MNQAGQIDKARVEHWDGVWESTKMPARLDGGSKALNDYPAHAFHQYFEDVFSRLPPPPGATLIELGCGRSVWLPYFATTFGLNVAGLDYSQAGCDQAKSLLARDQVQGDIRCGDIFDPPADMRANYDVVASFGLVEHFSDTADCLRHCAAFAKPGGTIITTIPNMFGGNGLLTRLINRPVYDMHVPINLAMLRSAHANAGLEVIDVRYLMPINLSVVYPPPSWPAPFRKAINGSFFLTSKAVWLLDRLGMPLPTTAAFSPYLACVARKMA